MKITYDILMGVIDGFVPADQHEAAMRWVLENAAQWGGKRAGAGRKKKTDAPTAAPVATPVMVPEKRPVVDVNTEFVAGHQGWQFPEMIRAVAAQYFTPEELRDIERNYSCQEYETKLTVAKLLEQRGATTALVAQAQPVEPEVIDPREAMFDAFWAAYNKQGRTEKRKAKQKFFALVRGKDGEQVYKDIMQGLIAYNKTDRVADGYVKGAYSWLLNEYWKTDWTVVGMKKKTIANADRAAGIMDLIKKYK